MKEISACFTGHRLIPSKEIAIITQNLKNVLIKCIKNGYRCFYTGGALGFDTVAAKTVLELKTEYPHIELILVLPCHNQPRKWKEADIAEYDKIRCRADKIIYTSEHYYTGCMHKRNRYLVDHSSFCICYLNHNKGGTAYTVDYAKRHSLNIVNIS